mgnify:CR=1 FL=1
MSKDKFKIISFILPNFLSIVAISLSLVSFRYTVLKDKWDSQERISVTNSSFSYDETLSYDMVGPFRGQGLLDGINYTIILSNNSKQKVSLISYEIFQTGSGLRFQYSNMVRAVKDQKDQEILFPLSIDAGDSVALTFEINTAIQTSVNMLLLSKYGVSGEIPLEEIQMYLGENGYDIFGNNVDYTLYGDGSYKIKSEAPLFPEYDLEILTSKGNVIKASLSQ